jgi:TatD DNase family protein
MAYLIDTHCHLDFFPNYQEIIQQANEAGVKKIIIPGVNFDSLTKIKIITTTYSDIFWGIGIHPEEISSNTSEENLQTMIKQIIPFLKKSRQLVAIGECGLDFGKNIDETEKALQIQLFKQHLLWSKKLSLPLIIHSRRSSSEIISLVENDNYQGVFHCFSLSKKDLKKALKTNFYFGIGGLITLDSGLQEVIKDIPLERIILETDAPYLTPKKAKEVMPWPNKPSNLIEIAETLADLKKVSLEEVIATTTKNARSLFQI